MLFLMGYADGYSLAQNKYRVKYKINLHVDDHRLYLPDGRRSGRLGETRVVDVVDVKEVVVRYDEVRNAAAPLRTSTRTERKNGAMECASTQSPHLRDNSSTREFSSPEESSGCYLKRS
jgi:hypothetical protein